METLKKTLVLRGRKLDVLKGRESQWQDAFGRVLLASVQLQRVVSESYPLFAASTTKDKFLDIQERARRVDVALEDVRVLLGSETERAAADDAVANDRAVDVGTSRVMHAGVLLGRAQEDAILRGAGSASDPLRSIDRALAAGPSGGTDVSA
ncbi:MAG: hypothetical protein HYS20_07475, partial [Rhodocyclales bacterium]|nr:hypothetical protein [Rhodocyclales bacterium]